MGARLRSVVGAALAVALALAGPARAEPSEADLKAEFIERFIRFVDWDAAALGKGDLTLCVIGDDGVAAPLDKIARSRTIKGKKAVVRSVDKLDRLGGCHVVIIGGSDKTRLAGVLGRTLGKPVLTIADAPGAAAAGAIINFYREDRHIRYEVNVGAGEDGGLILRAKLLRLARLVGERRPR